MHSKIVYLSYDADMMASLGIETTVLKRDTAIDSILKALDDEGVYIVYLNEAVYQNNQKIVNYYQLEKNMNVCVMGQAGAKRMQDFTHSTLGLSLKKEESH